jgi:prepilin-type N-terminal cleavage/methylation domain-containing protein
MATTRHRTAYWLTGFTIIELMSSIAILSVLIVVLVSMVNHTTSI